MTMHNKYKFNMGIL